MIASTDRLGLRVLPSATLTWVRLGHVISERTTFLATTDIETSEKHLERQTGAP